MYPKTGKITAVSADYNLEVHNWADKGESQPEGRD